MTAWPSPDLPELPGQSPAVHVRDSSSGQLVQPVTGDTARLYVCGITPYDATHMGHAATYVTMDLLGRAWRDSGKAVDYVQNVTDVDDPLLERAERDGIDWRDLAAREIGLFFEDMTALRVLPPREYVGVVESIPRIAEAVTRLVDAGLAYAVPVPDDPSGAHDTYLDLAQEPALRPGQPAGPASRCTRSSPSAEATPTAPASGIRWTRCSGAQSGRGSRPGTGARWAPAGPGGTSSAPASRWTTSACRSTCRAAAPTWSSRTTR